MSLIEMHFYVLQTMTLPEGYFLYWVITRLIATSILVPLGQLVVRRGWLGLIDTKVLTAFLIAVYMMPWGGEFVLGLLMGSIATALCSFGPLVLCGAGIYRLLGHIFDRHEPEEG